MGDESHSSGNKKVTDSSSAGQTETGDRRDRLFLLEKVKHIWVEGVLEEPLRHAAPIELGLEIQAGAVEPSRDMAPLTPDREDRPRPPGKKLVDSFDQMGRAVLILGEPGSGKTVTLLELARHAITRAEDDPAQPIPAIFNLSSWSVRKQSKVWPIGWLKSSTSSTRSRRQSGDPGSRATTCCSCWMDWTKLRRTTGEPAPKPSTSSARNTA